MASLALKITRKNPLQVIALASLVASKLAPAAPETPPIADMAAAVAALLVKKTAAETANDAYESAKTALIQLKLERDAAVDALRGSLTFIGKDLEVKTQGDPIELAKTGLPLSSEKTPITGPPDRVMNLNVTAGDQDGTLDGNHDTVEDNKLYEVQISTVDDMNGPYTTVLKTSASSWTLTNQTSGQRVWTRVRATNGHGDGDWSTPVSKIVP